MHALNHKFQVYCSASTEGANAVSQLQNVHPSTYLVKVMQSVNQHIFDTLLVEHFQAQERPSSSTEVCTQLTAEEENILRYASGFIPFKLLNRYLKQSTEKASQFVECLSNMAVGGNETSFHHYTTEWIRKVNRGGLFYINDDAYKLFYRIEQEVRTRLPRQ